MYIDTTHSIIETPTWFNNRMDIHKKFYLLKT